MADKARQITKFFDDRIRASICVAVDYDPTRPELVFFTWKPQHPYKNWQCFDYITSWLKQNDIWFSVGAFQVNQCDIFVHSREARAMLKLMFDPVEVIQSTNN